MRTLLKRPNFDLYPSSYTIIIYNIIFLFCPGTPEERGLVAWKNQHGHGSDSDTVGRTYDIPLITPFLKRLDYFRINAFTTI